MRVLVDGFWWSDEHRLYAVGKNDDEKDLSKDDCILELPLFDA